jgi:hypothetical protein
MSKPAAKPLHTFEDEDFDCPEVVGSKDLREAFKEKGRLRGSFSVNGYMFRQFEATTIENLLGQINAHQAEAHVDASIDDGYHLVIEARSPAPIVIVLGPAYEEVPSPMMDPQTHKIVEAIKADRDTREKDKDRDHDRPKNTILDDLGLSATEHDTDKPETAAPGTPAPGLTADDRRKRREEQGRIRAKDGDRRASQRPLTDTSIFNPGQRTSADRPGELNPPHVPGTNIPLTRAQEAARGVGESGHAAPGRENLGFDPTEEQKITGSSQGTGLQHPS